MSTEIQLEAAVIADVVAKEVRKQLGREDFLTTSAAAQVLQLSRHTLAAYRRRGIGPEYIGLGKLIRYRRSALHAWIARMSGPGGIDE